MSTLPSEHEVTLPRAHANEDIVFKNPFNGGRPIRRISYTTRHIPQPYSPDTSLRRKKPKARIEPESTTIRESTPPARRRRLRRGIQRTRSVCERESVAKLRADAAARRAAVEKEIREARRIQILEDALARAAGMRRSGRVRRKPVRWVVEGY